MRRAYKCKVLPFWIRRRSTSCGLNCIPHQVLRITAHTLHHNCTSPTELLCDIVSSTLTHVRMSQTSWFLHHLNGGESHQVANQMEAHARAQQQCHQRVPSPASELKFLRSTLCNNSNIHSTLIRRYRRWFCCFVSFKVGQMLSKS